MAQLGMFGGAAPRLRRYEDPYLLYQTAPQPQPVEEDTARIPFRRRATASSVLGTPEQGAPAGPPPMGMFGTSAKAAKLATPKTAIPMAEENSGYTPGKRDWMKEIGSDPLGFLLTGTRGLSDQREEAILSDYARKAEAKEQERLRAQNAMLDQMGVTGRERLAYLANPEKYGESVATNYAARNIAGGDSAYINGELTTAPKFGESDGYFYEQGPEGVSMQGQRPMTYTEQAAEQKAKQPSIHNTGQSIVAVSPDGTEPTLLYRDPQAGGSVRQPPSGYNWTPDGLLAPIQGGPADPRRSGVEIDPKIISLETQQSGKWMPIQNNFADIRANFDRISTLAKNKNSASDLGLIVSFTKMLDPGSVAREGEVQLTQQAAGLIDQASVWLPRLQSGKTLLPDNVRQMYVDAARSMFGSYEKTYQGLARDTQSRASQYGLSPDRIMLGYEAPAPMAKTAATPAMQLGIRAYSKQSNIPADAITEFLSNPSTPQEMAEFDDAFGAGQAEAILKAMQSGR